MKKFVLVFALCMILTGCTSNSTVYSEDDLCIIEGIIEDISYSHRDIIVIKQEDGIKVPLISNDATFVISIERGDKVRFKILEHKGNYYIMGIDFNASEIIK